MKRLSLIFVAAIVLAACSTTDKLPEGESLFVGLKEIAFSKSDGSDHYTATREEVDASLQTAPNGALFGSSYYRTPFPYGLWIYNAFSDKEDGFSKWMTKTFGKPPVLMNNVNPILRAQVANNILKNNGYFHGNVTHEVVETSNPKKKKLSYNVDMGEVCLIDTFSYTNFPTFADSIIASHSDEALIKKGTPFSTATLDAERNRVTRLLRNSGYYYYQPSYSSYLADTVRQQNKMDLQLQMADSLPDEALHPWYIGKLTLDIKKDFTEQLTDSTQRRHLKIRYAGDKVPVRPRIILSNTRMFPRRAYNYQQHNEAISNLASLGLFNSVDFRFSPRDNDTLDLNILCVMEKPYDFYVQTHFAHKFTGRTGPGIKIGLQKRNAFHGGELFDLNLHSSYEWQQSSGVNTKNQNSYEFGADASLEWPRLIIPFLKNKRYAIAPATKAALSYNIINRPGYYRMNTASAEWSYAWRPNLQTSHRLSPLILTYQKRNYSTEKFDSILNSNSYLQVAMQDMYIPKLQYSYTYTSNANSTCPAAFNLTLTESGNFTSLFNKVFFGQDWTESGKTMFGNVYSQFLKVEAEFRKTWKLNDISQLVAHANAGAIWSYGNMSHAPYTEQFYIGGANSVRAFTARGIGPGGYISPERSTSYVDQTGDILLLMNLEYRRQLFGSLYGAIFLDAGNVWAMKNDADRPNSKFEFKNLLKQTALGTGIGLRYDMDFLVLRVDWGVGLHAPYETSRSGFYNFERFKDSHTLHLAVGYPF